MFPRSRRVPDRAVRDVAIILRVIGMTEKDRLVCGISLKESVIAIGGPWLVRYVCQAGKPQVLHLPFTAPVAGVVPLPVEPVDRFPQMEIPRAKARIDLLGDKPVKERHVEPVVVHDAVEVDPDSKPVRDPDQVEQLLFRSVAGGHPALLLPRSEVKTIKEIVAYRKASPGLGWRRKPERFVARFRDFRHLLLNLPPAGIEILQHRFTRNRG